MNLRFHRSHKMSVKIQKPDSVRAFVFEVQVGIGKKEPAVDPLSGMLLNLVKVDEVLHALKALWNQRSWSSLTELLADSQEFLRKRFQDEGVLLHELFLNESRQRWLGWRQGQSFMGQEEIRELNGEVCRLRWNSLWNESQWQQQQLFLSSISTLDIQNLLSNNPQLLEVEIEQLAGGEKWSFRKV